MSTSGETLTAITDGLPSSLPTRINRPNAPFLKDFDNFPFSPSCCAAVGTVLNGLFIDRTTVLSNGLALSFNTSLLLYMIMHRSRSRSSVSVNALQCSD